MKIIKLRLNFKNKKMFSQSTLRKSDQNNGVLRVAV